MPSPTSYRIDGLAELNPRRILCCQQHQIGDVILLTPAIHMLKTRFPDAEIDVLTEQKCVSVLENNPEVAHVWGIDRKLGFLDSLKFYRHVGTGGGRGRYDLIIDFQQLPRIRWVLLLSDARVKLSYPPSWYNRPFYTHWAPVSGPYAAKCKAGVVMHAFGIAWNNDPPRLYLTDSEKTAATSLLHGWGILPEHTLITVDATHRRASRLWPAAHYARLMALAASVRPDLRFLLLFGPGEEQLVAEVRLLALASGLDAGSLVLPEQMLSLRQMAAVQSCARLHLGNCSSPRHFAVAVGTPTLTVRGSTSNAWTYPASGHEDISLGLPCQPCDESGCHLNMKCLTDLAPEAVLPRLLAMLR